jgi:hypothetical protein
LKQDKTNGDIVRHLETKRCLNYKGFCYKMECFRMK